MQNLDKILTNFDRIFPKRCWENFEQILAKFLAKYVKILTKKFEKILKEFCEDFEGSSRRFTRNFVEILN